jgi:hypothetical protein
VIHLLLFGITQTSVVIIIFVFIIAAFFFFSLIVFFFLLMLIVVIMVVVVAIVLWQLLRFFSRKYHNHDLKGILLLRNVLQRVRLWLLLRWHIPWRHLTSGLTSSALVGCATRMNHLKFGNMRE